MKSKILNEEDFKVVALHQWGFKKGDYKLGEDRVDIKLANVWLEVKQGTEDIYKMLSQIIFTAHRARLKSADLPIAFGCFNSQKGALINAYQVYEVFLHTDINWNQAPSNLDEKTVARIKLLLREVREYSLDTFGKELKEIERRGALEKKQITKNNFLGVYEEWLKGVGQLIRVGNNEAVKEALPDCYLADLMTDGKKTIAEKLKVILKQDDGNYYYKKRIQDDLIQEIKIEDQQKYGNFWGKYARPPKEEYQDYIRERRDLLQPGNVRERKGAFFTPEIWCRKSKEYIEKAFGENWQDEYFIWDCACGTGNLEQGLVNQERVFMSTLDQEDLDIMKQNNIMPNATHFQFDFLNDAWLPVEQGGKIPNTLWKILQEYPERLIIYINPPYLEVTDSRGPSGTAKSRHGATTTTLKKKMTEAGLGRESNELFMQFYYRIYKEIEHDGAKVAKICSFSKLKNCNAPNFEKWRLFFKAKFKCGFVCRANTFDNVKGQFPISFQVWDCDTQKGFEYDFTPDTHIKKELWFSILNNNGEFEGAKKVYAYSAKELINNWFTSKNKSGELVLGYARHLPGDFQGQRGLLLSSSKPTRPISLTSSNIVQAMVYYGVRLCIPATWLNDRDQFTKPVAVRPVGGFKLEATKERGAPVVTYEYEADQNFINNCIVFALFEKNFTNWQLFPNSEVGLVGVERDMTVYNLLLKGRVFSAEATRVLNAGREVCSLYYRHFSDYQLGFDGLRKKLKEEKVEGFAQLWEELKSAKKALAEALQPDVYRYGFLKEG